MPWLDRAFCSRTLLRVVAFAVILLGAVPAKTETQAPSTPNPENVFGRQPSSVSGAVRWVRQPTAIAAAPRTTIRYRKRWRSARAEAKPPRPVSIQPAPITEPFTQQVQIWPTAKALADTGDMAPISAKTVRETRGPDPDDTVVRSNELSNIDLAARPPIALASTDGRAALKGDYLGAQTNRFTAFAETVTSLPQTPWFESVLLVMAAATAAFFASRVFVRPSV